MKHECEISQTFYLRQHRKSHQLNHFKAVTSVSEQEQQKFMTQLMARTSEKKELILILCEGKTEVYYFRGLVRLAHGQDKVKIMKGVYAEPLGLVEEAKSYLSFDKLHERKLSEVWVVFDRDQHRRYRRALAEACQISQIKIAWSNPCFELWFLLHFKPNLKEFTRTEMLWSKGGEKLELLYNSEVCVTKVKIQLSGYNKTNKSMFHKLRYRTLQAIENVAFNQSNPHELGSSVGLLVRKLSDFLLIPKSFWEKA